MDKVMEQNGKPRQAAPGIRSTVSYIIFLENVLGQGATSKVYLGRHKKSGKRVACKVPHMPNLFRVGIDMDRESQVLLRLRHPNIVCLEAVEKDQISRDNILIMELCTGGSLYDMLERPEHANGLQEKVFLNVLNDITGGMKYLRDNGFVHRDVKPGNIMCFRDQNGKTIYKLADFGAARELTDDENFTSLHGTEEYLHPNVFERAVLRRPVVAPFDARVDLWSIGATLYHIATGLLPFRPQGGRKNSAMMFHLTTKKASGVISGVQTGPSEADVIWSNELPETAQLSVGLKKLLTPILAGLLEYNPAKVWSFNQFFEASQAITAKKPLDVFWVSQSSMLRVYANPTDTFAEFQELVGAQTKVPVGKQMFLLNGETFKPDGTLTIREYPTVSDSNPIIMCNREKVPVPSQIFPPLVAIMPILHPRFSTQNDYPIAKNAVTVGHILQKRQAVLHSMLMLFDIFVMAFSNGLRNDVLKLQSYASSLKGAIMTASNEIQSANRLIATLSSKLPRSDSVSSTLSQLSCHVAHYSDILSQCELQYKGVCNLLARISSDLNKEDGVGRSWKMSQGCNLQDEECVTELQHLTTQMEDIFRRFTRDKKVGKLSYNDEQIHKMEKLSLGDLMKQTMRCISKCEEIWRERHTKLMIWFNEAYNERLQITEADKHLAPLVNKCEGLKDQILENSSKIWQVAESQVNCLSGSLPQASAKEIQLSSGTQTSPVNSDVNLLVNGSYHPSQQWTTNSGQPLSNPVQSPFKFVPSVDPCARYPPQGKYFVPPFAKAASAPSCSTSYRTVNVHPSSPLHRSSPSTLTAHGMSSSPQDAPSELRVLGVMDPPGYPQGAMAPDGDLQQGGAHSGSRMIKVSKRMKQDMENYRKQSSAVPQILRQSQEMIEELGDLSLGNLELQPNFHDDSSFLSTLTGGAEGGCDIDDDIGSLEIRRPPTSYRVEAE